MTDLNTEGERVKVFYFGCIGGAGHYMHAANGSTDWKFMESNPWGKHIDTGLCPAGPEIEGQSLIHHKDGWTALSFWDRSVDKRGKCNSSFLAEGDFDFEQMVQLAKEHFPSVMARFKFPIVELVTA